MSVRLIFEWVFLLHSTSCCLAVICLLHCGTAIVQQLILSMSTIAMSGDANNVAPLHGTTKTYNVFVLMHDLHFECP